MRIQNQIDQQFYMCHKILQVDFIKIQNQSKNFNNLFTHYFTVYNFRAHPNKKMISQMIEEVKERKSSAYDQNGFKTDQFSMQLLEYLTDHQEVSNQINKWKQIIPRIQQLKQNNQRALIYYVREGIPDSLRSEVWPKLIMKPVKPYEHYHGKVELKQIQLDLDRTFPNNKRIKQLTVKMRSVLNALAIALPDLGYCQGMNFISALILLKLNQEESFNMMHHIFHWEKHQDLLTNLGQIHRKMFILEKLIKKYYPKLFKTLKKFNIQCLFFASPWFITLFCNTLPCAYALRILQMYLLQGQKILYRAALQILKIKKAKLKTLSQFQEFFNELKNFQDLVTTDDEINNFFYEMFEINLSRKDIEAYDKQFKLKEENKQKKQ